MGKNNNIMSHYFSDSRRFADLFDVVFFGGKPVVEDESLSETSQVYHQLEAEKPKTGQKERWLERIRDVSKQLDNRGVLRLLALENQNQVDYAMPFRCMQYDTMERKSGTVQDHYGRCSTEVTGKA